MRAPAFDPFSLGGDPFPEFARIRASGGTAWGVAPYPEISGAHYVFSHSLVTRAMKHPALMQSPPGAYDEIRRKLVDLGPMATLSMSVLLSDPPRHAVLRRPMAPSLARPAMEALTERLRALSQDLVSRRVPDGYMEAVSDLSVPVAFWLLQEVLGLQIDDPWELKSITLRMAAAFDLRLANPEPDCPAAYEDCRRFLEDRLRQRAYRPDGMVARMVEEVAEGRWSHHDMIANLVLMLFAGQETVVDAFGNALVALDRFPAQRALLENRTVSWSDAAAEFLRYGASVQYAVARIAAKDLELGDIKVAAGDAVMPVLGSANRDEAVFPDGDRLDLTRTPAPILTFGSGLHVCLGQHIARIEIAAMLEALFQRAPGWRLDTANAKRRASHSFHGMSRLPLTLG